MNQQLKVHEPHHLDSSFRKERIAESIMSSLISGIVSSAIKFHGKAKFVAIEVQNIRLCRMLSAELKLSESPISKRTPELILRVCGLTTQLPCEGDFGQAWRGLIHGEQALRYPHPCPLPKQVRDETLPPTVEGDCAFPLATHEANAIPLSHPRVRNHTERPMGEGRGEGSSSQRPSSPTRI